MLIWPLGRIPRRAFAKVGEKSRIGKHPRHQIVPNQYVHLVPARFQQAGCHVDALDTRIIETNGRSLVHLVAGDLRKGDGVVVGREGRELRPSSASPSSNNADANQRRVHFVIGNRDGVDAVPRLLPSRPDLDASEADSRALAGNSCSLRK